MNVCFPGTVVPRAERSVGDFLFGIFSVTKGLTLSQVREITGLDTSAVQNWTQRGWLPKPMDKRYGIDHLSRIIIINMLRDTMKLESIADLLTYINGVPGDISDDVIQESRLYAYLCAILDRIDYDTILKEKKFDSVISEIISDYNEPFEGGTERLVNGLKIILTYYAAALVKRRADAFFDETVAADIYIAAKEGE